MYPEEKVAQFVCRFEHFVAACMAHTLHARREPHNSLSLQVARSSVANL